MKVMIRKAINISTSTFFFLLEKKQANINNKNYQIKRIKTKKLNGKKLFKLYLKKDEGEKSEIWFISKRQFTTSNIEYNYICLFVVNQSSSNKLPPCSSNINILIIFSSTWSTATTFDASWISSTTTTWSVNRKRTWLYKGWVHSINKINDGREIFCINRPTFYLRRIA